ncbi:MAG: methionyl-tRNA formyltransferase [Peptostreptococcaceae bacterium]|nr:methionyl-tRNA formyltransferase [Peptostreptococcaceae bacterium]MDY5738626.1 methionyl-tRNA formyltransferase [Anaerovoracaceae bacterium]
MKIIFMGTPDFAVPSLKAIIEAGHDVGMVITQPDRQKNRGKKLIFSPVKEVAMENGIPVFQPERLRDDPQTIAAMRAFSPDIVVVAAYGQILSKELLDMAKHGAINVHGSLLPKLRGASPIQRSILLGYDKTGVTIMKMAEGLDTGDMISKVEVEIGDMTYGELSEVLADRGSKLLVSTIDDIAAGKFTLEKQDDNLSSYAPIIKKEDGRVDFNKSAFEIQCQIRAYDPWPGTYTTYGGQSIKLWRADVLSEDEASSYDAAVPGTIVDINKENIVVACGKGYLRLLEIQPQGKKRMTVKAYLLGNSFELLQVLGEEV